MNLVKKVLLVGYSLWAYAVFFAVLLAGAGGYALVSLLTSQKGRERRLLWVNNGVAVLWGALCGVRFSMEQQAPLSRQQAYLFTPNHGSTLDMLIGSYAFRYGMRFLVKKELKRIPFLGFMFSRIAVFVDRSDAQSRKESRETLKLLAGRGVSFCVFPEGTRNRGSEPLGRFYDGAFDAALSAGIPVVPLVFIGSRTLMPMGSFLMRPGPMKAVYLKPIPTAGLRTEDLPALREQVYRVMHNAIVALDPAFQGRALLQEPEPLRPKNTGIPTPLGSGPLPFG
jgi:1-acyl-sn-glycerol-3-phosphate acyltransferase